MQFEQSGGMYVATGVLFLIPCTLLFFATKNLFRTDGALPLLRRYFSCAAVFIAAVSTIMHIVWTWGAAGGFSSDRGWMGTNGNDAYPVG